MGARTCKSSPFESPKSPITTAVSTSATYFASLSLTSSLPQSPSPGRSSCRWRRKVQLIVFHFLPLLFLAKCLVAISLQLGVKSSRDSALRWISLVGLFLRYIRGYSDQTLVCPAFSGSGRPLWGYQKQTVPRDLQLKSDTKADVLKACFQVYLM